MSLFAYFAQIPRAGRLVAALAIIANVGCAAMTPDPLHLWGDKKDLPLDPASQVTVEIRPAGGEPKLVPLAYDDTLVVQTGLEKSGAIKRFSRMNVSLIRPRPDGQGTHKMEVTYDHGKRRVSPSTDYALRPGDRIVAIEDTATNVDDALQSLAGPLKSWSRKK